MKQLLFTALLCAFFSFSQNIYCQDQIIFTNCPDLDTIAHCMDTRWDTTVGEFALIDIKVNVPTEILNNNWKIQFATSSSVFIEYWNFRTIIDEDYTHEYSYVLPINSSQSRYAFAVYLVDDVSGLIAYGPQMTFDVCDSNSSQKLFANIEENIDLNKYIGGTQFELTSILNEQNITDIEVFPNPFGENFSIQYETIQNEDVVLEIFDTTGNLKFTTTFQHMTSGIYQQSIENLTLEKGIYICKVRSNKSQNTIKLLRG